MFGFTAETFGPDLAWGIGALIGLLSVPLIALIINRNGPGWILRTDSMPHIEPFVPSFLFRWALKRKFGFNTNVLPFPSLIKQRPPSTLQEYEARAEKSLPAKLPGVTPSGTPKIWRRPSQ